ncbi:hypothetical protein [Leptothoe kymatousa]|uniref:Uncharacterized protein n=1 Tax=Leptothoe kymatousa TAU-MAC 1615 TaxID=2364775 RepID=A0ABS5Y5K5_9CYAN|nr:hypothetical protein [Leptothoe kymatousa]MBT9313129.1 hypothetical protein [Leptothoe kymatousa TAU-MAC 1615]
MGLKRLAFSLGLPWCLLCGPSYALPGQSVDDAKTWMQGHPTLQADRQEGLRVHRVDVPSRRFTFQASVFPIGGFQASGGNGVWPNQRANINVVRREEFILVDYDEPVTLERLEESLRTIYGADIYADYRRAERLNSYGIAPFSTEGDVRLGNLYAYWLEITADDSGAPAIGKFNVVLPEDVDRLQAYLQR